MAPTPTPSRTLRTRLVRALLIAVSVLVVDVVASVVLGARALSDSGRYSDALRAALGKGDVRELAGLIDEARNRAASAVRFSTHPGPRLMASLPVIGREFDAFKTVAEVARGSTDQAAILFESIAADMSPETRIAELFYQDGAFDLQRIEALESASGALVDRLDELRESLDPYRDLRFLGPGVSRAKAKLDRAHGTARSGTIVARLLWSFAGADEARRYLLAFQSPSEARGGGGLIGVYGILDASEGRVRLAHVGPIEELGPSVKRSVRAPPSFADMYGPLSGLRDWRQANLSPSFPMTSRVLLRLYQRVRHERLDGVIAVDPIALGALTKGIGNLSAPGWGKTIDEDNARRVLLFDIYRRFVHQESRQNAYLRGLLREIWNRMSSGDTDVAALIGGLNESARKQHLKMFSSDVTEQGLITQLGLAADPTMADAPVQMLFNNNNSGNKVDFFLHREQDVRILLGDSGEAFVETTVTLENDLPTKGRRAVTRSGVDTDLVPGENRMSLHFLLPAASRDYSFALDGRRVRHYIGRDSGSRVVWALVTVPPDATRQVTLSYELAEAYDENLAGSSFEFVLWPQATARPDSYTVEVMAPEELSFSGGSARFTGSGRLKTPRLIALTFVAD